MLEIVGLSVGAASLIVTVAVYLRQRADQSFFERALNQRMDNHHGETTAALASTRSDLAALARAVSANPTLDEDEPIVPPGVEHSGTRVAGDVDRYEPGEIPLRVLADLVTGWQAQDDGVDRTGWTLGTWTLLCTSGLAR